MFDIQKDVAELSKHIKKLGALENDIGEQIVNAMVDHLFDGTCNRIPLRIRLSHFQLLTIQRFLNDYGFHIQYVGTETTGFCYSIVPNWK